MWRAAPTAAVADGPVASVADRAVLAAQIMAKPDIRYTTRAEFACSGETWARVLEEPQLMGVLWRAYQFGPPYEISGTPDSLRIWDPTGLEGDAFRYERGSGRLRYLILGKLKHWAVPVLNKGRAVFELTWTDGGGQVTAEVTVYVQAGSGVGSVLLRIVRPLLASHVENRVSLNLVDAQELLTDIERHPQQVARRLQKAERADFERVFGGR